jgi:hypothetical protein
MRGEFSLAPSRELLARHALAASGGHAVEANCSPSEAEEQRFITQFKGPCGE